MRPCEGEVGFRIGTHELTAGPGDAVIAKPGVLHSNWNQGGVPAVMRIEMRPAHRWEEFVRQSSRSPAKASRAMPPSGQ